MNDRRGEQIQARHGSVFNPKRIASSSPGLARFLAEITLTPGFSQVNPRRTWHETVSTVSNYPPPLTRYTTGVTGPRCQFRARELRLVQRPPVAGKHKDAAACVLLR